jgi:hypothetical protein
MLYVAYFLAVIGTIVAIGFTIFVIWAHKNKDTFLTD